MTHIRGSGGGEKQQAVKASTVIFGENKMLNMKLDCVQ